MINCKKKSNNLRYLIKLILRNLSILKWSNIFIFLITFNQVLVWTKAAGKINKNNIIAFPSEFGKTINNLDGKLNGKLNEKFLDTTNKNSFFLSKFEALEEENTDDEDKLSLTTKKLVTALRVILNSIGLHLSVEQLFIIKDSTAFLVFLIATAIFLLIAGMTYFLDYSIRARTCQIYEGCSSSSYVCEYVIKLRYGLISGEFDFLANNLVIEFLSEKRTLLSRFFVSGTYFEDGLNVGTYLERDMRLTTLILYKRSLLTNLYYARLYIEGPDTNIGIHVYNLEVGNSDSTLKFELNSPINEKNEKMFKLNQIQNVKCTSFYKGPMIETSYFQAFLFIYFFFCATFLVNQLFQTRKFINLAENFIINVDMLTNSVILASSTAFLYTIFRDVIHLNYCLSNGSKIWMIMENIYEIAIFLGAWYCVAFGLVNLPKQSHKKIYFINLILITTLSLFIWIPLAFVLYLKFSPRYFHLGRIVLQSQVSKYYPKNLSKIAHRMIRGRKRKTKKKEHRIKENKKENIDRSLFKQKSKDPSSYPQIALYPFPPGLQQAQFPNFYPNYIPGHTFPQTIPIQTPNMQMQGQNVPGQNVSGQNLQILPHNLVQFNQDNLNAVQQLKTQPFTALMQTHGSPATNKPELIASPNVQAALKNMKTAVKKTPSNSSLLSTGSNYYAQIFQEGKIPKVGSISQYGSLLGKNK